MTVRELAQSRGFTVVGKLKRLPDAKYGIDGHYAVWIDEAGNEYMPSDDGVTGGCIVTHDGGIL